MQAEAPDGVGGRAVLAIADDRMAQRGKLNANLILAAGLQRELEQRPALIGANQAIVRDCLLAAALDAPHFERLALDQVVAQRSSRLGRRAFDDRKVLLRDI